MKTIITSKGNTPNAGFDLRFGRGAFFCLYDSELSETIFIENIHANAQGGAGTKTAEKMVELGVRKVISGDFGPKAKALLNEFHIKMETYQNEDKTISDMIKMFAK